LRADDGGTSGAGEVKFGGTSSVFINNDTGAACTVTIGGSLHLAGCNFYMAYDTGVSSHAADISGNYVWTTVSVSGNLTIDTSTWTQFGGALGGSGGVSSSDTFTCSGTSSCTLASNWKVIMDVTGTGGSGYWKLISGYNVANGTAPSNTQDIGAYPITYNGTYCIATY
jgi:hypothetical protein